MRTATPWAGCLCSGAHALDSSGGAEAAEEGAGAGGHMGWISYVVTQALLTSITIGYLKRHGAIQCVCSPKQLACRPALRCCRRAALFAKRADRVPVGVRIEPGNVKNDTARYVFVRAVRCCSCLLRV